MIIISELENDDYLLHQSKKHEKRKLQNRNAAVYTIGTYAQDAKEMKAFMETLGYYDLEKCDNCNEESDLLVDLIAFGMDFRLCPNCRSKDNE